MPSHRPTFPGSKRTQREGCSPLFKPTRTSLDCARSDGCLNRTTHGFYPPEPPGYVRGALPTPDSFFRSHVFVWRSVGVWTCSLKCPRGDKCVGKGWNVHLYKSDYHHQDIVNDGPGPEEDVVQPGHPDTGEADVEMRDDILDVAPSHITLTSQDTSTVHPPALYKRHLSTTSNSQTPNSTMAKTKELSKDTRNKIVDLHQAGNTESPSLLPPLVRNTPFSKAFTSLPSFSVSSSTAA
ncbi:hypothetical protein QTP86_027994, partial [Hemibagrus guttatus]